MIVEKKALKKWGAKIFFWLQCFFVSVGVVTTIFVVLVTTDIVRHTEKYQEIYENILRYEEFLKQEISE